MSGGAAQLPPEPQVEAGIDGRVEIDAAEFPALAELITLGGDADAYLDAIGVPATDFDSGSDPGLSLGRGRGALDMPCTAEKVAVGAASAGVAGSAVIAAAGAPTVVVTVGALVVLVGAIGTTIATLLVLAECMRNHGKDSSALRIENKVAALEEELARLRALLPKNAGDEGF